MIKNILHIITVLLFLSACSTTKYVPDGEYLLGTVEVKDYEHHADVNTTLLRDYVRQRPNARWFSLYKLPLATYSLSGRDTTKWINRTLRAMGEAPVLFDSLSALQTCADLEQQLRNEGFLQARVDMTVSQKGRKKKSVSYGLHPGEPYTIGRLRYVIADSAIATMLATDSTRRLLREGMTFNVATLDAERKRITSLLADSGYYRFHKEYITYRADTIASVGKKQIDLTLHLALPVNDEGQSESANSLQQAHRRYTIRNISYSSGNPQDSVIHLRRHVLTECTHLQEGDYYRSSALQNTYNHFGRLQAVKYTNITLTPVDDSLDCHI